MKKLNIKKRYIAMSLVVIVLVGGFVFRKQLMLLGFDLFLSGQVEKKLEGSYEPIEGKPNENKITPAGDPFSTLLLGIDQRGKEVGRSDTIIYTVARPKDDKILMVSIPRDTYAEIVGKDKEDKINHAYAFGGKKMIIDSVSKLVDEPVDHYATINFQGFIDVVDALGGVELPITKDIVNKGAEHEKFTVKGGKPIYSGQEALYYVRYREDDHINRSERNMVFVNAIMNRMTQLNQITKVPELISIMGDNFTTDIEPKKIIDLAKDVFTADHREIYSYTLKGEGGRKANHIWYYIPDEKDLAYIHGLIDNWMDPNTKTDQLMVPAKEK
ncbi:LCP family protein [Paenibacillus terrigena]|uniref:LCP family protein n=1 Tax=Paenibacillus terrigena TaxID=369333 RepID=UPI0028D7596C|nr:LCP family protein [Paenibacillus terrigena]